jgi:broad specificity phosphatase PhoE
MTTLYFMRHAESEANLEDILASQLDFPLTEKGKMDAQQIAQDVQQFHSIDHIICSPLLRAKQTAAPFEQLFALTAVTDARVIEQNLGKFAGKSYTELDDQPDYCHDRSLRWKWIPGGGGESYEMIAARLQPFFEEMFAQEHEHILIITHAVTLRLVKSILLNILPDYPKDIAHNGEIWQVELMEKGKVHTIKSHFYGASEAAVSRA